jgi:hypothetical protein
VKPLRIEDLAEEELKASADHYEAKRSGLGLAFELRIREAFGKIQRQPGRFPFYKKSALSEMSRQTVSVSPFLPGIRRPHFHHRRGSRAPPARLLEEATCGVARKQKAPSESAAQPTTQFAKT